MKQYKFTATIQPNSGGAPFVFFPYDTKQEFGTRAQIRVKATFDGVPYSGALVKYADPQHLLPVTNNICAQIGKGPGDRVSVVIERDESVRTIEIPAALKAMLKKEGLLPVFEKLSYTHRREYIRWITEAKKEETRITRQGKAIDMLRKGVKTPD
jgi:hypothetical protein